MKYFVDSQVVLFQAPEGPLVEQIRPFARSLREKGYAPISIHRQASVVTCFSRWLKQKGVALHHVRADHCSRYLSYRARRMVPDSMDASSLKHLLEFLRRNGVIAAEKVTAPRLPSAERYAQGYERYLREVRALSEATIVYHMPFIRRFLTDRFGSLPVRLSRLSAHDVVRFVQQRAPHLHPKCARRLTGVLRSFLRYARYRGDVVLDLAAAVPAVANWSMPSIPRAIGADQVRELLASIPRGTAIGRRDYAILLLLARLGLRAGEVAFLELEDIDWDAGQVNVRGKGGQQSALPLPTDVGEAIAAYLYDGRPYSTNRRVFLRGRAPVRGFMTQAAIGSIVRHSLQRTGIQAPTRGAHQFRHALASQMLHHGASLKEIGEVLRHRRLQTTTIYAKVDLKALRTLALPWPGGAR